MTKGFCDCLCFDFAGCGRPLGREQASAVAPRLFKLYLYYNPGGNNCSLDFLHIAEEKTFYTPIINNLNYFHYEDEQFEHREWQEVCSSYD